MAHFYVLFGQEGTPAGRQVQAVVVADTMKAKALGWTDTAQQIRDRLTTMRWPDGTDELRRCLDAIDGIPYARIAGPYHQNGSIEWAIPKIRRQFGV